MAVPLAFPRAAAPSNFVKHNEPYMARAWKRFLYGIQAAMRFR